MCIRDSPSRVYTVMGDGELAEGSVWEGVMAASQYKLDNLCAVVDRNRLQISGSTEDVMHHDDLAARFAAFGWNVLSVPGNDIDALLEAFEQAKKTKGCPTVVIANTTKGCGVSFKMCIRDRDISGLLILNQCFHQFSRLMAVAWHVDPHVRNRAHGRKILGRMMAHSQGPIADSSADSYQLHICVGVGHIHLGLFIASRT